MSEKCQTNIEVFVSRKSSWSYSEVETCFHII